ncbi:MAG: ATP-binding cassette domain-containing protein [Congregibacter sp.]|nr:ATP-binding cassette domain-containing protein [Congregibacter sp.]
MSIRLTNVSAVRGSFSLQIPEWAAEPGEFHAVLGANGAGKSSFFAVLTQEMPYQGEVHLHGKNLSDWPSSARARHLGVLPQHTHTSFAFSTAEVVELGLTPLSLGRREARHRVGELLERVGCLSLSHRPYLSLSGGERQRVNLARVLLQLSEAELAPLLLLDEPTSAQDLGQQHAMLGLVQELARERRFIVVAILHDLNQALRYCDGCLLLAQGAVAAVGAPADILQPDCVAAHWGYRPEYVQRSKGAVLV